MSVPVRQLGAGAPSIFDLGHEINSMYISTSLIAVIAFTIVFELFTHYVEHKLESSPVHLGMLRKLYSELMILGFISFIIFMLIQTGTIGHGGHSIALPLW